MKRKPWLVRYRWYVLAGMMFLFLGIYVVVLNVGPRRYRVDRRDVRIVEAKLSDFLEYVDVEGVVQPIMTIQVNCREGGNVVRIVGEEGDMVEVGDILLVLENAAMEREISDKRNDLEKLRIDYRERAMEMEQQRLTLKKQHLQTEYEMKRLEKNYRLNREEHAMGIKSRSELEMAEDEYLYRKRTMELQREELRSDSVMALIRREMLQKDMERGEEAFRRETGRLENLVVRAPVAGQLGLSDITMGQQLVAGQQIGMVKVLDRFKMHASLNEYYVDRLIVGLPASIRYQDKRYGLKVSKVVPEVKERAFDVDLVFTDSVPDNLRLGKSYRLNIELGQPEQALVIPCGDFYGVTGGKWIFKLTSDGKRAVKVPLSVGRKNPLQYEILDGVAPGDRLVVTGYDRFKDVEELLIE